mmetsp:Transcript_963/g.3025  ORF Transcript_963/g.3025 Transcript_963/m.3025 type:complete len:91 (+) Transcript_963:2-274(+)
MSKFFGAIAPVTPPVLQWFGLALGWITGTYVALKTKYNMDSTAILQIHAVIWTSSLLLQLYQQHTGQLKSKECTYVTVPVLLLTAYFGFM